MKCFECKCVFDRYDGFGLFDVFYFAQFICILLHHAVCDYYTDEGMSRISLTHSLFHYTQVLRDTHLTRFKFRLKH